MSLTFDKYQEGAKSTAIYPGVAKLLYPVLGLAGECSEVIEKLSDALFYDCDGNYIATPGVEEEINEIMERFVEAGQACEKLKKQIRGGSIPPEQLNGIAVKVNNLDQNQLNELVKEVSDELWYSAAIASDMDKKLSDIAQANLDKLQSRKQRGVLHGNGDNR